MCDFGLFFYFLDRNENDEKMKMVNVNDREGNNRAIFE